MPWNASPFFPHPWNIFPLDNAYTHKLKSWIITGFIYMNFPTLIYDMVCLGSNCISFSLQQCRLLQLNKINNLFGFQIHCLGWIGRSRKTEGMQLYKTQFKNSISCFLNNSFSEMYFPYHKIHFLKVYNSVVFSIFTKLYNHHRYLISEHFHHHKKKPGTL